MVTMMDDPEAWEVVRTTAAAYGVFALVLYFITSWREPFGFYILPPNGYARDGYALRTFILAVAAFTPLINVSSAAGIVSALATFGLFCASFVCNQKRRVLSGIAFVLATCALLFPLFFPRIS